MPVFDSPTTCMNGSLNSVSKRVVGSENSSPIGTIATVSQRSTAVEHWPDSIRRVLAHGGHRLEQSVESEMAQRFRRDFSNVRVHTDRTAVDLAADLNAQAFTIGNNIVFGAGSYVPTSKYGQRLLAHELTHVVQQGSNNRAIQRQPKTKSEPAAKDPAKLRRLAKDPRAAHRAWKTLRTEDKFTVIGQMSLQYGSAFANKFQDIAEYGKPDFSTDYWQPGVGPTSAALKARGYALLGEEVSGTAAISVEVWVTPAGTTIRRDVHPKQKGNAAT